MKLGRPVIVNDGKVRSFVLSIDDRNRLLNLKKKYGVKSITAALRLALIDAESQYQ